MNNDITRCTGWTESEVECPIKCKCLRYTMRPDPIVQWTMYAPGREVYDVQGEPPDWECEFFMPEEDT